MGRESGKKGVFVQKKKKCVEAEVSLISKPLTAVLESKGGMSVPSSSLRWLSESGCTSTTYDLFFIFFYFLVLHHRFFSLQS